MTTDRLVVDKLTVEFSSGGRISRPVEDLTFSSGPGSLVLMLGPSGCGKTTVLSCVAGLKRPTSGTITYGEHRVDSLAGQPLNDYRRHRVGIVFQTFNLIDSLTAAENVAVPLRAAGVAARLARRRAVELLERVGLAEQADKRPGLLSGGQQQRIAIARALALDPPVVIADEPTAHLDHFNVEATLRLLSALTNEGRLVLVSTHDDRLLPLADQIIELAPRAHSSPVTPAPIELADGQTMFRQGAKSDWIYTIVSGSIDIIAEHADGREEVLARLHQGEWFGEMGPLFGLPRSATARAVGPAVVQPQHVTEFRERLGVDTLRQLIAGGTRQRRLQDTLRPQN